MKIFKYIFGIFTLFYSYAGISQDLYSLDELKGEFQDLNTKILEDMESLPEAVSQIEKDFDEAIKVLQQGIGFLSANEVDFETVNIFDQINVFENITSNISNTLPSKFSHNMDSLDMGNFSEEENELLAITMKDMQQIKLDAAVELTKAINSVNESAVKIDITLDKLENIGDEFALMDFERFKSQISEEMSVDMDTIIEGEVPSNKDGNVTSSSNNLETSDLTKNTEEITNLSASSSNVNSVTTEVSSVSSEVSQVTSSISEVTEDVSQVSTEVSEVTEEVSQIVSNVEEVTKEVTQMAEQVTEVTEDVSEVAAQVAEVTEEIQEVAQEIAEASEEISEATSSLSEEAQIIANWLNSQNIAESFTTNLKDQWGRNEYNFVDLDNAIKEDPTGRAFTGIYSAIQESTAALEALAANNEDIECVGGSCTFSSFSALKDWEDFNNITSFCESDPGSHQAKGIGVSGTLVGSSDGQREAEGSVALSCY